MKKWKRSALLVMVLALPLAAGAVAMLGGCNTVKGVGRDITSASETTEGWFKGESDRPGYSDRRR